MMAETRSQRYQLREIRYVTFFSRNAYDRQKVMLACGHEVWCSPTAYKRARCIHCPPKPNAPSTTIRPNE